MYRLYEPDSRHPRLKNYLLAAATTMVILANGGSALPQGSSATDDTKHGSDSEAILLIEKVLHGMGGASAWQRVGAATNEVKVSLPDGTQRQMRWAHDWSGYAVLSRRDLDDPEHGRNTIVASGPIQTHTQANGAQKQYPSDPDIVILAVGYPGAALARSLQSPGCMFSTKIVPRGRWPRSPTSGTQKETIIYEQCVEPNYPDGRCDIVWLVDPNTQDLRGVWLPIRGILDNSITFEQVRFLGYRSVGDLSVPSDIRITRPNGRVDALILDQPTFSSQLPKSAFDARK